MRFPRSGRRPVSIRGRIFFSYLVLIVIVLGYVALSTYVRTERLRVETDRVAILEFNNTWNGLQIALHEMVTNWRDGRTYAEFLERRKLLEEQLDEACKSVAARYYYPDDFQEHFVNMQDVWAMADEHFERIVERVEQPEFSQVEQLVRAQPGLQQLNYLWVELSEDDSLESRRLGHVVQDLISEVGFFPIYSDTVNNMVEVIVAEAEHIRSRMAAFERLVQLVFFLLFVAAYFWISSRSARTLSAPVVRVAQRLQEFIGHTGHSDASFGDGDEVETLSHTVDHMIAHYTHLSEMAGRLAKGEIQDDSVRFPRGGVVGRSLDEIAGYLQELARTSVWIRHGMYGTQIRERSENDVLARNFNVMSAVIYEKITTLRSMFEAVDEGAAVINDRGQVIEVNAKMYRLFGAEASDQIMRKQVTVQLADQLAGLTHHVLHGGAVTDHYTNLRNLQGHEIPVKINARALPYVDDEQAQIMFLVTNESWRSRAKREQERLRAHAAVAELKALRAQINPHFFFNTLNTIAYLIEVDSESAVGTIEKLAELFRYALAATTQEQVKLADELLHVQRFLDIESLRYGSRLKVQYCVEEELKGQHLQPMLLQPLVENAVRYGADDSGRVHVQLSVQRERDDLMSIKVSDYGSADVTPEHLLNSAGTGIRNVNRRLKTLYGRQLVLKRNAPQGLTAEIRIPLYSR